MEINFSELKNLLKGKWKGSGFAKFPTIKDSDYTETWSFTPDRDKDAICYNQKTWYKDGMEKNGQTLFWDTGFILLKEGKIFLVSAQVSGRLKLMNQKIIYWVAYLQQYQYQQRSESNSIAEETAGYRK